MDRLQNLSRVIYADKKWEWKKIKEKTMEYDVEEYYEYYMGKLRHNLTQTFIITYTMIYVIINSVILCKSDKINFLDIYVYFLSYFMIVMLLALNLSKNMQKQYKYLYRCTIWPSLIALWFADIYSPVYFPENDLKTFFEILLIIAIFILFPIANLKEVLLISIIMSCLYISTYGFLMWFEYKYFPDKSSPKRIIFEIIFMTTLIIIGLFLRITRDISVRFKILAILACVRESVILQDARDREGELLECLLPKNIASRILSEIWERIHVLRSSRRFTLSEYGSGHHLISEWRLTSRKLFIESHRDVSILFADIVNYTYLTSQISVRQLVEALHELYVRFDKAAEDCRVLRIKFLGDCYECVANVSIPNEQHAQSCVDLGLKMISAIRKVKERLAIDLNMRIGVHTGSVLSGVVGIRKWQYDIWSVDVDIANRLEQTGLPGYVHISEQTKDLLGPGYAYRDGTIEALEDPVLRRHGIHTYLIQPEAYQTTKEKGIFKKTRSVREESKFDLKISETDTLTYRTRKLMRKELKYLPLHYALYRECSLPCQNKNKEKKNESVVSNDGKEYYSNINPYTLMYTDKSREEAYDRERDPLLKYSMLVGLIILTTIVLIMCLFQMATTWLWIIVCFIWTMYFLLVALVWWKKIWCMFFQRRYGIPQSAILIKFLEISIRLSRTFKLRLFCYLATVCSHFCLILLNIYDCYKSGFATTEDRSCLLIDSDALTVCVSLYLIISLIFVRMRHMIKFCVVIVSTLIYSYLMFFPWRDIFNKSLPTNVGLLPVYSHFMYIMICLSLFVIWDRRTEFIGKVDYNWKFKIDQHREETKKAKETIKVLLNNLLPMHVAEIYMRQSSAGTIYIEEYDDCAVLFVTVKNIQTDLVDLELLNAIICVFDEVLNFYTGNVNIEKIKINGWTYLAASGLTLQRRREHKALSRRAGALRGLHSDIKHMELRSSQDFNLENLFDEEVDGEVFHVAPPEENAVFILTQFATDLMRSIKTFNEAHNLKAPKDKQLDIKLRVGIASGEIMAGVVGHSKPHYDIWGDTVNMASRMDSTGIVDKIQITEKTANELNELGISCTYRGFTYVKGRGEMPTYFVDLDSDYNFIDLLGSRLGISSASDVSLVSDIPRPSTLSTVTNYKEYEVPHFPDAAIRKSMTETIAEEIIGTEFLNEVADKDILKSESFTITIDEEKEKASTAEVKGEETDHVVIDIEMSRYSNASSSSYLSIPGTDSRTWNALVADADPETLSLASDVYYDARSSLPKPLEKEEKKSE